MERINPLPPLLPRRKLLAIGHSVIVVGMSSKRNGWRMGRHEAKQPETHSRTETIYASTRGGAVAMNINSGDTPLVLLCPAWKKWGSATTVKSNTTILHSKQDDVVPFPHSQELVINSGLPPSVLRSFNAGGRWQSRWG